MSEVFGQTIVNTSSPEMPRWTAEPPKGKFYTYYTAMGLSDSSLIAAQKHAVTNILSSIAMEKSVTVQSILKTFISEVTETIKGKEEVTSVDETSQKVIATGESRTVENLIKEEEYWQEIRNRGKYEYKYWVLMKIPKPQYANMDPSLLTVKQSYGILPVIQSAVVPGWGQIQKRQTKKGLWYLTGFSTALAVGITTQKMSDNYSIDAQNADTGKWIDYYNSLSKQYYIASTISYILAGTIYGLNVYDAISSRGAKIYAYSGDSGVYLSFVQTNSQIPQLSFYLYL